MERSTLGRLAPGRRALVLAGLAAVLAGSGVPWAAGLLLRLAQSQAVATASARQTELI